MDPVKPVIGQTNPSKTGVAKHDIKEMADALPKDSVEKGKALTREERIRIALARTSRDVASNVKIATGTYSGFIIGTAAGFAIIGGLFGPVIGGAIGAISALAIEEATDGTKAEVKKTIHNIGKNIKDTFRHALGIGEKRADGTSAKDVAGKPAAGKTIAATEARNAAVVEGTETRKSVLGFLNKGIMGLGKVKQVAPKFLYPSIKNATAAEKELVLNTLDRLPLKSVTSTESITINARLAQDMNASGLARNLFFMKPIDLDKGSMAVEGFNRGTIIHEIGHTRDFSEGLVPFMGTSSKAPWGKPPYVFDKWIDTPGDLYASTNHWEDFAQSYKFFYEHPHQLQKTNPAKYEYIKNMEKPDLYTKVVDKPSIREFGKKLSAAIDKVPGLRLALDVLSAVTGPLTMHKGAGKIKKGITEGDKKKIFDGKMDLASGVAYSSRIAAPAGLAIDGVHWYLNRKIKKGKITLEKADSIATNMLAVATGPVGLTTHAAIDEMLGKSTGTEKDIRVGEAKSAMKATEPIGKYTVKKAIAPVLGTLIGGIAGAVIGTVFFGGNALMGSAIGASLGTPGGILAKEIFTKKPPVEVTIDGKKVNKDEAKLTKDDKIYIAKVAGGAAVGGIAGTLMGASGGTLAGAAVGGLIGGPIGAGIGAFIGKVGGALVASHYGARAGAKIGKSLT